jgi:hypothetical protein
MAGQLLVVVPDWSSGKEFKKKNRDFCLGYFPGEYTY